MVGRQLETTPPNSHTFSPSETIPFPPLTHNSPRTFYDQDSPHTASIIFSRSLLATMDQTLLSPLCPTSVTLVSPLSQPLWTRSFPASAQADLAHTHLAFAALDFVDAAVANGAGVGQGREGYLGQLLVLDGEAVCVLSLSPTPPASLTDLRALTRVRWQVRVQAVVQHRHHLDAGPDLCSGS